MFDAKRRNLASSDLSSVHVHRLRRQAQTVELVLEADVLAAICHRGRRRLRDIQQSCDATLKLDRVRGVLHVAGSESCINMVQKQLESLAGPSLTVSPAVWTELMRTRTNPDPTQAAIACIQQETGCRIHIERNALEVRLFGGKSETVAALQVFQEFERMCIEKVVDMQSTLQLDLQGISQDAAVTLKVEAGRITVLGIEEAVEEAAKCLHDCDGDEHQPLSQSVAISSDFAREAIGAALGKLTVAVKETVADNISNASTTADSLPPTPLPASLTGSLQAAGGSMQGLIITKMPPQHRDTDEKSKNAAQFVSNDPIDSCPTCGSSGHFCVHCGKKVLESTYGCQTCGVPKFCIYCGQPTERMAKLDPGPAFQNATPHNNMNMYMPSMSYGDHNINMMQMQSMTSTPMIQMPPQTITSPCQSQVSQLMVPEGMMMSMCMPIASPFQQSLQGYPETPPMTPMGRGMQTVPVMMPAGMQTYIMAAPAASFE